MGFDGTLKGWMRAFFATGSESDVPRSASKFLLCCSAVSFNPLMKFLVFSVGCGRRPYVRRDCDIAIAPLAEAA